MKYPALSACAIYLVQGSSDGHGSIDDDLFGYNRSMINMAKRQSLCLWIAMLAILFSALAPTVSYALAAVSSSADTVEICTVDGYKFVNPSHVDSGKAPAPAKHGMTHCAFCTTHGGAYALTGSPSVILAVEAGRTIYPPLFYAAPHSLHVWCAANPRAPPILA